MPFVRSSLQADGLVFSYIDEDQFGKAWRQLVDRISEYIDFKTNYLDSRTSMIILLPPEISEETLLKLQARAKKICVYRKIMIGALYPESDAPSLHSDAYFPLRTPTPTLVLRDLVPMDILFLVQERHNRLEKLSFLGSYIDKFQNTSSSDISLKVDDARLKRRLIFRQLSLLAFALAGVFIVIGGGFALL